MVLFAPPASWEAYVLAFPAWFLAMKYIKAISQDKKLLTLFVLSIVFTGIVIPFSMFIKIIPINAITARFIPAASHLIDAEPYKFFCLPLVGVFSLVFMWFSMRPSHEPVAG